MNQRGFFLGKIPLALTTQSKGNRKATEYLDMEFWHDQGKSVYRPSVTLDLLKDKPGFRQVLGKIAISFEETENGVKLKTKDIESGEDFYFTTRKLVLCAGVLGTARIVMRSINSAEKLPILCNPYYYIPMINWSRLGQITAARKTSMGQLVMFHDPLGAHLDVSLAVFFTFRSLMLFRLIKESPLNFSDGRALMHYLLSAIVICGVHHSERPGPGKFLKMGASSDSPTGDVLEAEYGLSDEEEKLVNKRNGEFFRTFRQLGCFPIKKVNPGYGASIHYAGTLPVSQQEKLLHTSPEGLLYGTKNVYVGDGSSFSYLPAKGISLTLMANAHIVAKNLLAEIQK